MFKTMKILPFYSQYIFSVPIYIINNRHLFITNQEVEQSNVFPATGLSWPLGIQEVKALDFLDFQHYEGGKVITPMHRPSLLPAAFPGTHF